MNWKKNLFPRVVQMDMSHFLDRVYVGQSSSHRYLLLIMQVGRTTDPFQQQRIPHVHAICAPYLRFSPIRLALYRRTHCTLSAVAGADVCR